MYKCFCISTYIYVYIDSYKHPEARDKGSYRCRDLSSRVVVCDVRNSKNDSASAFVIVFIHVLQEPEVQVSIRSLLMN